MNGPWVVIEHYRDGGTWRHGFTSRKAAEQGIEGLQEAHKGRTYELVEPEDA